MKTLKDYARDHGIGYRAAWNRYKAGRIPSAFQDEFGKILLSEDVPDRPFKVVCYSRVSSSQNKSNLDSQAERLVLYCNSIGLGVSQVVKEVGSGLNDHRRGLLRILGDCEVTHIVVEHRDRLTRFGFEYLRLLAHIRGIKLVVINEVEVGKEELMSDFVSLVTSFCARLYGLRRSRRQTEKIIGDLSK